VALLSRRLNATASSAFSHPRPARTCGTSRTKVSDLGQRGRHAARNHRWPCPSSRAKTRTEAGLEPRRSTPQVAWTCPGWPSGPSAPPVHPRPPAAGALEQHFEATRRRAVFRPSNGELTLQVAIAFIINHQRKICSVKAIGKSHPRPGRSQAFCRRATDLWKPLSPCAKADN